MSFALGAGEIAGGVQGGVVCTCMQAAWSVSCAFPLAPPGRVFA